MALHALEPMSLAVRFHLSPDFEQVKGQPTKTELPRCDTAHDELSIHERARQTSFHDSCCNIYMPSDSTVTAISVANIKESQGCAPNQRSGTACLKLFHQDVLRCLLVCQ